MKRKDKKDRLPFNEESLEDLKYLGVGFFEWIFILGVFGVIFSAILKNF